MSPGPSRPLPRAVYWRRRAVALGLLGVLVLSVVNLFGGGQSADDPSAALVQSAPTAGPDSGDREPRNRGERRRKNRDATGGDDRRDPQADRSPATTGTPPELLVTPAPLPEPAAPDGECESSDLIATARDTEAAPRGPVTIELVLRTVASPACTWRVDAATLALTITDTVPDADGDIDEVWSSRVCPRQLTTADVVVRRAEPTVVDLTWNGRRSLTGCVRGAAFADPGEYHVQVAAYGGAASAPATLTLTEPEPEPTPEPPPTLGPEAPDPDQDQDAPRQDRTRDTARG